MLTHYHEEYFLMTNVIFFTTAIKKKGGKIQPSLKPQKANFWFSEPDEEDYSMI